MEFITETGIGGYHRAQVDAYVGALRQAYQQMYEAQEPLRRRCDELQALCNRQQGDLAAYQTLREAFIRLIGQTLPMEDGYGHR